MRVTIPEGSTVKEINDKLILSGVISQGGLESSLEGHLFPDTYEFFVPSAIESVRKKFTDNFDAKAMPLLSGNINAREVLITASIIEKEVSGSRDRRIVSGIIWKRLRAEFPLQVDATICYAKESLPCHPITKGDLMINSPYNTYRNKGLPPAPIANPGLDAITAALRPEKSPYWFYLSDPKTQKTIFSVDLDEHHKNIVKYLN
ncbi:MAG: endolytic transglycosylase MltG [Candidatus Colwellbacteria bacterium]|nr:endolytic transglycosylase MltG [Candidatus Colwellbacteria bacterium]